VPTDAGPAESGRSAGGAPNTAPILDETGSQVVTEGGSLTLDFSALDVDGDQLTYEIEPGIAFGVFTDNLDGTASWVLTPGPGDAGQTEVTVTVRDNGSPSLTDSESFLLTVSAQPAQGVFLQDADGLLSVEAEHFDVNAGGAGFSPWMTVGEAAASGGAGIKAVPGDGTTLAGTGPRTEYSANFLATGEHYIWLRFRSFDSGTDSVFVELDNQGPLLRHLNPDSGNWEWIRVFEPVTVTAAGTHVIKLYRREAEVEVDKLVVTSDPAYVPTDAGPLMSEVELIEPSLYFPLGPERVAESFVAEVERHVEGDR